MFCEKKIRFLLLLTNKDSMGYSLRADFYQLEKRKEHSLRGGDIVSDLDITICKKLDKTLCVGLNTNKDLNWTLIIMDWGFSYGLGLNFESELLYW